MMEDRDTKMADPQSIDQRPLESQSSRQDLHTQIMEVLHQVNVYLSTLHNSIHTLPNYLPNFLHSGQEDLLVRQTNPEDLPTLNLTSLKVNIPTSDNTRVQTTERRLADLEAHNAFLIGETESTRFPVGAAQQGQESHQSAVKRQQELLAHQTRQLEEKDQAIRCLRNIALEKAGTQGLTTDEEVTSKLINLRRQIETIARLPIYHMDGEPKLSRNTDNKQQLEFFGEELWGRLAQDEPTKRMMTKIFDLISINILNYPFYGGAEDLAIDPRVSKGNSTINSLAHGLRLVERELEARGVPDSTISSWRIRTIDCFENLKATVPERATVVSDAIYDFFGPLLVKPIQRHPEDELRAKLLELCSKAVDLRMIMRRSTYRYTCEVPGSTGWPLLASKCEELVETMAVERGRPEDASDEIAFTLFGGCHGELHLIVHD